ncbi:MAG: esterase-like activity of phytase family protein, partial [Tsuneonella sp.]
LRSRYPGFDSFSAMVPLGGGRLLAASDAGHMAAFGEPGRQAPAPHIGWFAGRKQPNKFLVDIEAMTRDPATGRIWVAYEGSNAIVRFESDLTRPRGVRPPAMRDWPGNTGPETLVRLRDGRFIVISEARTDRRANEHPALLFASDPVEGGEPLRFRFAAPGRFRAVDAALLPDGRVLILLRTWDWLPPRFRNRLVVADPSQIEAGKVWTGVELARIEAPLPSDNYEGLAVEDAGGGAVDVWLISDDNRSSWQRELLLHLRWPHAYEKARGIAAGPHVSR